MTSLVNKMHESVSKLVVKNMFMSLTIIEHNLRSDGKLVFQIALVKCVGKSFGQNPFPLISSNIIGQK